MTYCLLHAGNILFLGAFYVTEATKRNNELTFKADDGLGSDIQVVFCSDDLSENNDKESISEGLERIIAAALINIFVYTAAALISSEVILKDSIIEEIKA